MIDLVKSLLPANVTVYDTSADDAGLNDLPYVVVIGGSGARSREESACGRDSALGNVIVRAVGLSRDSVMGVLYLLRDGLDRVEFTNQRGLHRLILDNHRSPRVDNSAVVPGTSRYPLFADDEYTIFTERLVDARGVDQSEEQ